MNKSMFFRLRKIIQGKFVIENDQLFYHGSLVSSKGTPFFASDEEVFFLFDLENENRKFKKVVLLNSQRPQFFKVNEAPLTLGNDMQFITVDGKMHAFCRVSYGRTNGTKIIECNFQSNRFSQ